MNLFVVVEGGDHHVSLLDGDRFEVIHRFASRYALHGGPKFTPDGRFVFFGSRDGWITKYDLWNLTVVAEVRAGLNMRNVAVSGDGRWVMAANYLPRTAVLFDADLNLVKRFDATTLDGKRPRACPRCTTPRRATALSSRSRTSPKSGRSPTTRRRAPSTTATCTTTRWARHRQAGLPGRAPHAAGRAAGRLLLRPGATATCWAPRAPNPVRREPPTAQVVNLDVRRKIAELPIAGMPHLGSGITFAWNGTTVLASPNLKDGAIDVIDMKTWKTVKTIPTPGPGFFMRSHENTPLRLGRLDDEPHRPRTR
jgi:hypothetical protein